MWSPTIQFFFAEAKQLVKEDTSYQATAWIGLPEPILCFLNSQLGDNNLFLCFFHSGKEEPNFEKSHLR